MRFKHTSCIAAVEQREFLTANYSMSTNGNRRPIPFYQDVDGFRIPGCISAEAFRSALRYKPRPDDLFIVTHPKCGTTWVQNIVACIYNNGEPFESFADFVTQAPFLELTGAVGAENMKRPGAIKVHLPFHMTPYSPEAKYIFVARNPKDCCVSFYHHTKFPLYRYEDGTFDDFFELFIEGKVDFGDYFETLLSWYAHKDDENVLFITYEELKKNTEKSILRIAQFMGKEHKNKLEQNSRFLKDVMKYSSVGFMKGLLNEKMREMHTKPSDFVEKNPSLPEKIRNALAEGNSVRTSCKTQSEFVRKGIIGDWKNYFSKEQSARLEAKFENRTKGTSLQTLWRDCM